MINGGRNPKSAAHSPHACASPRGRSLSRVDAADGVSKVNDKVFELHIESVVVLFAEQILLLHILCRQVDVSALHHDLGLSRPRGPLDGTSSSGIIKSAMASNPSFSDSGLISLGKRY